MIMTKTQSLSQSNTRSSRRLARQCALQMLFQHEFQEQNLSWQENFWNDRSASPDVQTFAANLVGGVMTHKAEIDQIIRRFAIDWSVERMPVVDRNVLRCAIYELLWEIDIPAMATINEAIELAKRFADDEARRFINGLLDHVLREEPRLLAKRRMTSAIPPSNFSSSASTS
jgi:N utilization substance protein B